MTYDCKIMVSLTLCRFFWTTLYIMHVLHFLCTTLYLVYVAMDAS